MIRSLTTSGIATRIYEQITTIGPRKLTFLVKNNVFIGLYWQKLIGRRLYFVALTVVNFNNSEMFRELGEKNCTLLKFYWGLRPV